VVVRDLEETSAGVIMVSAKESDKKQPPTNSDLDEFPDDDPSCFSKQATKIVADVSMRCLEVRM
jgi:hypothetical protein